MRVLALDLSYVMSPSMSRYASFPTSKFVDVEKHWDSVYAALSNQELGFSLERLAEMTKIFSKALKNVDRDQVYLLQHQSDILSLLAREDDIVIHNVDHFHDFDGSDLSLGTNTVNIDSSWISELDRLKLVSEYVWWKNRSSQGFDDVSRCNCSRYETSISRQQPMKNPDVILVSKSPHIVPPKCQQLFNIFENMFSAWFDSDQSFSITQS